MQYRPLATLLLLLLLGAPAAAAADVPPYEPVAQDSGTGGTSGAGGFERGRALGRGLAPLCCICVTVGMGLGVAGLAFYYVRRGKS